MASSFTEIAPSRLGKADSLVIVIGNCICPRFIVLPIRSLVPSLLTYASVWWHISTMSSLFTGSEYVHTIMRDLKRVGSYYLGHCIALRALTCL